MDAYLPMDVMVCVVMAQTFHGILLVIQTLHLWLLLTPMKYGA